MTANKPCGAFWEHCNQSCFAPCDHPYCPGPHPNIRSAAERRRQSRFRLLLGRVIRPDDMTVAEERAAGCDCGSIDGGHPGDCAMFKPLSRPGTPGGESDG